MQMQNIFVFTLTRSSPIPVQICGPLLCNRNRATSGQSEDKNVLHLHLSSLRGSPIVLITVASVVITARGCVICVDRQGQSHRHTIFCRSVTLTIYFRNKPRGQ